MTVCYYDRIKILNCNITVNLTAMNDYDPIKSSDPRRLTFLQCSPVSETEIEIRIFDDNILEHDESFAGVLRLDNSSDAMRQVRLEPAESTVHIIDEDSELTILNNTGGSVNASHDVDAVIGFDLESYEVSEGDDSSVDITVKVLEGQLQRDVIVQFDTVDNTAVSGMYMYVYISVLKIQVVVFLHFTHFKHFLCRG